MGGYAVYQDLPLYLFGALSYAMFGTVDLMNTKLVAKPTLSVRLINFSLEALKLFGIAIVCLAVIGIAVVVSARTGIVIPSRWFGLCFWTGFLAWIICRQYRSNLRQLRFWVRSQFFSLFILLDLRSYSGCIPNGEWPGFLSSQSWRLRLWRWPWNCLSNEVTTESIPIPRKRNDRSRLANR